MAILGLPPYSALAAELKFGNEAGFKCGSLAQELKPLWLQGFAGCANRQMGGEI
jgi:hypothetical protein